MSAIAHPIRFDAETHRYWVNDVPMPSVTQVLDSVLGTPWNKDERAAQFGSNVHHAVALDLRGQLDVATTDEALLPYVEAARRFVRDQQIQVVASEHRVYHSVYRYCGTLDLAGYWNDRLSMFDWKTGSAPPRYVGAQLAGYANAYDIATPGIARYCVMLHDDATYSVVPCKAKSDWSLFLSALNVYRYHNGG